MSADRPFTDVAVDIAWAFVHRAGFVTPMRVDRCTMRGYTDAYDVNEDDGTRVAIVGHHQDAVLIAALINREVARRAGDTESSSNGGTSDRDDT